MSKQYVIYCRKSSESEERQVLSIESQIKELKELVKRLDLSASEVLTESRSAKYPGRPVFGRVLEKVSRGEVKGLICWKLDRLARNPLDGAALVWALDQGKIEEIVTPYNHLLNNSNDKFLMQLEFGMAKKYVDDLSDNVRRGNRMKLEKGWLPGRAPLGYMNEPRERTIIPDPERFPIVRKMWELLLEGVPPLRICKIAIEKLGLRGRTRPVKPVSVSTVYALFTNPFYYGVIRRKGKFYQGRHDPIITEAEFWKGQEVLGRKGVPRPKNHAFAFTGLIKCGECGCSITAEEKVNHYGTHYTYYHCTKKKRELKCTQKAIEERELENQMKETLHRIRLPQGLLEVCLGHLEKEHKEDRENETVVRTSLTKAHNDALRSLENLNQMRLRELINDEEYLIEKRKLLDKKIRVEESLKATEGGLNNVHDLTARTFGFAHDALERFENGTPEVKKSIMREIGSNFFLKDKTLSIDVVKPFQLIQKTLDTTPSENGRLELPEKEMNTTQSALSGSQFLVWCTLVNDVRTFFRDKLKNGESPTSSI